MTRKTLSRKDSTIHRMRKIASAKIAPTFRPIMRKGRSIRPGTCANCGCPEKYTNLWRSGKDGKAMKKNDPSELRAMLCNACGLWLSEKGTPRPSHLATKWLVTAREDAEAQYQQAINDGADPKSISVEDYMPRSQPVMPIAVLRGPDDYDSGTPSPHSTPSALPSSPPISPTRPALRRSRSFSPRPQSDYTVRAMHEPTEHDHEAASVLMDLFSQAKSFSAPTSHAGITSLETHKTSSSQHEPMPSCRLFDKSAYVPAWMKTSPRLPMIPQLFDNVENVPEQPPSKRARCSASPTPTSNGRSALSVAQMCQPIPSAQRPRLIPSHAPDYSRLSMRRESSASSASGVSGSAFSPISRRVSCASSSQESATSPIIGTPVDQALIPSSPSLLLNSLKIEEGAFDRRSYFA